MTPELQALLAQLNTTSPKSSAAVTLLSQIVNILAESQGIDFAPIQAVIDAQPAIAQQLQDQQLTIAGLADQLTEMHVQDGALLEQISALSGLINALTERVVVLENPA